MGCAVARQAPTLSSLEHQHHPRSPAGIVSRAAQEKVLAWAGTGSCHGIPHAELLDSLQCETMNDPRAGPSKMPVKDAARNAQVHPLGKRRVT